MAQGLIQSRALAGAKRLAQVSDTLAVVSCEYRITTIATNTFNVSAKVAATIPLPYMPHDICVIGSAAFSPGSDGALHKYTTAPLAEVASAKIQTSLHWAVTDGTYIIAGGQEGRFGVYTTSLAQVALRPSGLTQVQAAACDSSGNLYLFDGLGLGAYFTLAAGVPTFVQNFKAPNCVDIATAWVDIANGVIVIGSRKGARVITLTTDGLFTPNVTVPAPANTPILTSVFKGDPAHTPCLAQGNPIQFADWASVQIEDGVVAPFGTGAPGSLAISKSLSAILLNGTPSTPYPPWVVPLIFHRAGTSPGTAGPPVTGNGNTGVLPFVGGGFTKYSPLAWITTGAGQASLTYTSGAGLQIYLALVDPIGGLHTTTLSSGNTVDLSPGGTYGTGFGYGTWRVYAKLPWPNATSGVGQFNGCLGQNDTLTLTVAGVPVSIPVTAIDVTIPSPTFTMHLGSGFSGLVAVPTVGPCYSGMSGFARFVPGALGQDNPGLWGYQGGYYSGTLDAYGNVGGGGMLSAGNSDGVPPTKGNLTGVAISIDVLTPPGGYGFYSCIDVSLAAPYAYSGVIQSFALPISVIHP